MGVRIQSAHKVSISALSGPDRRRTELVEVFHRDLNPSCTLHGQETLIESHLRKPVRSHGARIAAERLTEEFGSQIDKREDCISEEENIKNLGF
jgi:hypothetical protein